MCSLYLGENLISGQTTLVGESRNIGQIIPSAIPLTDAGLHLLDGSLILGSGIYSAFVDYIADLYNADPTASYFAQGDYINISSEGTAISGGDYSGYPVTNAFDGDTSTVWGCAQLGTNVVGNAYIGRSGLTSPVRKIRMYQGYPTQVLNYCTDFKFQYSNDGSTWIDIDTVTNGVNLTWQEWVLPDYTPSGATHSFRILATGGFTGGSSNNWTVGELQIFKLGSAEQWWQNQVTTYGVCGKFVYDSVNNTVRLPKYNSKIYTGGGTAPIIGNGMTLGLTNGNTNYGLSGWGGDTFSQVIPSLYGTTIGSSGSDSSNQSLSLGITTDATKSGIISDLSNITTSLDGYWYIVIATTTKTDVEVDLDQVATDLNSKVNVGDLTQCHVVVETYQNGTSWYRVYDDGWCEQGGDYTLSSNNGSISISFLKPFNNTNYSILVSKQVDNNYDQSVYAPKIRTRSTTGFIGACNVDVSNSLFIWQASGYIAVGE